MIELKNVTKIYGKKKNQFMALKNVSLTIPTGASVAILGKSGSGKSTLMHAISGLDKPQKGQVIIDGQDILQLKPKRVDEFRAKKIGFIFQSFFVQGNESVIDNVSLPLEIARVPRKKRAHKINAALKAVDLYDKRKNRAKDLSGGQKQRLAIARAIVRTRRDKTWTLVLTLRVWRFNSVKDSWYTVCCWYVLSSRNMLATSSSK